MIFLHTKNNLPVDFTLFNQYHECLQFFVTHQKCSIVKILKIIGVRKVGRLDALELHKLYNISHLTFKATLLYLQ